MAETRTFPRYTSRLQIRFNERGQPARVAFTGDVSPSGIYVLTGKPPEDGAQIELEVRLPDGQDVKLCGVVCWSRPSPQRLASHVHAGFGVQLTDAPEGWYQYCFELQRVEAERGRVADG